MYYQLSGWMTVYGTTDDPEEAAEQVPVTDAKEAQYDDIIGQPAYIAYQSSLKTLCSFVVLPIDKCPIKDCVSQPPFEVNISSRGSAAIINWVCSEGHTVWTWNSQPKLKYSMQAGDFMLAVNILLSGINFAKVHLLFKYMNMGIVSRSTFFQIQNAYCVDAIKDFWMEERAAVIQRLATQDSVVALADGRMDSPGHCAQYCTYTAMENESKDIISVITVDKRETQRKSVLMEKEAFIRTMDILMSEVNLKEICTDAHVQISVLMSKGKYKDAGIFHSLDMWHGAKSFAKKIVTPEPGLIRFPVRKGTKEHLFYPEVSSSNLGKVQVDRIRRIDVTKKMAAHMIYIQAGIISKPYFNVCIEEVFLLPPVYEARTILAALDYNYHKNRPAKINAHGENVMANEQAGQSRTCLAAESNSC
ncbi:hypothetical protein ABVT39_006908 [Epinephelus coioides]